MNTQLFYTLTHLHCLLVSTVKLFLDERLFAPQLARVRTSLQYREKVCGILPHTRLPEPQLARVRTLCTWRTESHRFTTHACLSHSSPGFVLFVRGEQSHTVLPHTPAWATARQGSYSLYVENRVTPFYHTRLSEPQLARVRTLCTWRTESHRFTTHACLSHSSPGFVLFVRGEQSHTVLPHTPAWATARQGSYSLYVENRVTPFYHTRLSEPQLARVRTLCTWRTESHRFTTHACLSHSSPGFVLFVRGEQSHTVLPHTPAWATARQGSYSLYVENRVTPFYHTRLSEPQLARVRTLSTWHAVSRRFTTHICLSHSYNLRQKHWTAASFSPIPPSQCCFAGSIKTKRKVDIIVATLNEGTRGRAFFWGCPETFGWDCSIGLYSLYVVRGVTPFYHTRLSEPQLARVRTLCTWRAESHRLTTHACLSYS